MKKQKQLYKLSTVECVDYDSYDTRIIRAPSEKTARKLANSAVGDEGLIWEDPKFVTCEVLSTEGPTEFICSSYNAG